MIGLLRAEWIKLRTVPMNWVLGLIALAFPLLVTLLTAFFRGDDTGPFDSLKADDLASVLTGTAVVSALLFGVIAAASITSEYGFGTIRPTFAATPRRLRVVMAKGVISCGFAGVVATLVMLIGWFVGTAIANGRGAQVRLADTPTAVPAMVGLVVLCALMSLVGYALGMITRSTPAAVSILIVWPLIAEGLIGALIGLILDSDNVGQWMPFQAGIRTAIVGSVDGGPSRLAAGVYFGLFSLVIAAIGATIVNRRDA